MEKKTVYAIFFDFCKAFDLVDHELLRAKLDKYLPPMTTRWISSYLHGRKQRVKVGDHVSTWSDVKAGVIQGSVLGPTLFILFIADLNVRIPKGVKAPKYADDILAWSIIKKLVQKAADRIQEWTRENKMVLNKKKTVRMTVGKGDQPLYIEGDELTKVEQYKYLGVQINDQLDADAQWKHVSSGFNSTIYLLRTMRQLGFNQKVLVGVYKSLISSQIVANAATLCSISEKAKNEMRSMQKRALRAMSVMEHECQKHKIAPTDELIHVRCVTLMQRILNDPNHPVTNGLTSPSEPVIDTDTEDDSLPVATQSPTTTSATTLLPDTDENNNNLVAPAITTTMATRNQFEFDIARCKTERHMNTFVPKYMRELEKSGFTTEAAKRRAAKAAEAEKATAKAAMEEAKAKKAAKAKRACNSCGKLWARGAGHANHERACEAKAAAAMTSYRELPDFPHNFDFVTQRRPRKQ